MSQHIIHEAPWSRVLTTTYIRANTCHTVKSFTDELNISDGYLRMIRRGSREPGVETVYKMLELLGATWSSEKVGNKRQEIRAQFKRLPYIYVWNAGMITKEEHNLVVGSQNQELIHQLTRIADALEKLTKPNF